MQNENLTIKFSRIMVLANAPISHPYLPPLANAPISRPYLPPWVLVHDCQLRDIGMKLDQLRCLVLLVDKDLIRELVPGLVARTKPLSLLSNQVVANEPILPLLVARIVRITLLWLLWATIHYHHRMHTQMTLYTIMVDIYYTFMRELAKYLQHQLQNPVSIGLSSSPPSSLLSSSSS